MVKCKLVRRGGREEVRPGEDRAQRRLEGPRGGMASLGCGAATAVGGRLFSLPFHSLGVLPYNNKDNASQHHTPLNRIHHTAVWNGSHNKGTRIRTITQNGAQQKYQQIHRHEAACTAREVLRWAKGADRERQPVGWRPTISCTTHVRGGIRVIHLAT